MHFPKLKVVIDSFKNEISASQNEKFEITVHFKMQLFHMFRLGLMQKYANFIS